jgi:predicted RNA binding protein YcfA (HicA-like mRNA interferase family)
METKTSPATRIETIRGAAKNEVVKVRDAIKLIEKDGWYLARTRGSHRQFKHPQKLGLVTIAGHPSVDIPRGTLNSILKQARLKPE